MLQLPKQELKSYFDATCQISAQTPEVIEKIIGTSVRTSADVKSREDSPSAEQIPTQMPQVMEEDIAKLIEDKDRKEISTQTPDTLEEINGTSAERSQWREDSSIKVHISTQTNETDEVFRKSDETKGEDSPAKEQIGVQIPEVMKEIIRRSSEDKGQKEISTQKPDTSEEFTGTPAEKWMEDSPIKVQIRTQNPVVGEEYRPSDKTNMEDSCKKVLMSTPPSEGDVKIIGTSAEFQRKGSYHQEPISTQTSEVEKEIIGTSDEDKGLEDSFVAIQVCTQTFEVVEEVIRTPVEEMEQFSTQASEGVEENIKTGEEKVENSISKGPKISEKLKDLQEKLSVVEKNLKIPELKEEAFHVTKKLDLISRHNTTIQELYTRVTGMLREASKCDEFLREKFYDFSHRSLRAVHNNLNKSFADLQSEQGDMTTAEKRKLDSLILSRNGREKQIMYLDKILKRLFSSVGKHHQCHLNVTKCLHFELSSLCNWELFLLIKKSKKRYSEVEYLLIPILNCQRPLKPVPFVPNCRQMKSRNLNHRHVGEAIGKYLVIPR